MIRWEMVSENRIKNIVNVLTVISTPATLFAIFMLIFWPSFYFSVTIVDNSDSEDFICKFDYINQPYKIWQCFILSLSIWLYIGINLSIILFIGYFIYSFYNFLRPHINNMVLYFFKINDKQHECHKLS